MNAVTRNEVRAFSLVRPKTNLVPNAAYARTKEQLQSGFLGVFTWAYSGDARKTLLKLAFAPLMDMTALTVGKPPRAKTPEERTERRGRNQSITKFEANRSSYHLEQYVALKKVNAGTDSHFVLNLPIVKFSGTDSVDAILNLFDGPNLTDEARAKLTKILSTPGVSLWQDPAKLLNSAGLREDAIRIFSECLLGVRYVVGVDGETLAFVEFKIKAEEAQYLVSADWVEIRAVDLYPLFSAWIEAEFVSRLYGKSSMSISKIATTLPKHIKGDERVDKYNLGILMSGNPVWIPKDCDNTERYESMYSAAGSQKDGQFALRQLGVPEVPRLPINIPILVDWVNNKFTYSNSAGKPVVLDLAHVRKCTASMALNLLRRDMPDNYIDKLIYYANECKIPIQAKDYGGSDVFPQLKDEISIGEYSKVAIKRWFELTGKETVRYYDVMDTLQSMGTGKGKNSTKDEDTEMLLAPMAQFIKVLTESMIVNVEALFVKYAVSTIIEDLGTLVVLQIYGSDLTQTTVESNTINKSALNQGVDPKWAPQAAPLLTSKFQSENGGLLPHQLKIRNILRNRPDLAALPVDAGGGKSMLCITDILYEIANGESAPYIVMCPSHLVANYVSEIVEFTDGKVNVIPVTSYNIRTTGFARYMEILESAPINTILVVDYDCLKYKTRATVYGTYTISLYPVVDMLRRFNPGFVFLDESHFLRNIGSARMRAVMTLVADIKKKRIASGTMNPDSPSDIPGQMAILDPTVFGTRSEFNEKYGDRVAGNRVLTWKQHGRNSVSTVLQTLKENIVWAPAKRKEWACALPPRRDRFIPVQLTEAQHLVYDAIFDDLIMQIKKRAQTDKNAAKLLEKLQGKKASAEDEDKFGDLANDDQTDEEDEDQDDIGPALQPYLADIERFVTNPAGHPYARNGFIASNGERVPPLTGNDLKSPKAVMLNKILKEYLDTHDSKALVFTNYNESTDTLFAAMDPELQACGLLYKTSSKTEMVNRFKRDPKIRWMIGIRKSLEVGLNLQKAGYLVRIESVWNPGEQEQGDSRIERPDFSKSGDLRTELLFDTIVADRTIDITKSARLRAKIVQLAKFDNPNDTRYKAIEEIPVIPMTLESITTMNDFNSNLVAYQKAIRDLNTVIKEDYDEYREKIIAEGGFKFTQILQAPVPPGAALLSRVPYAQGTELYKASELGLIRVDNYLGLELTDEEEGEDTGDDAEDESKDSEQIREQRQKIMGLRCHCEFGDGIISGAAAIGSGNFITRIHVLLDDDTLIVNQKATSVFIVTRNETNGIDMRNKLAQQAGMKITAPITVPAPVMRQKKISKKILEQREQERLEREGKIKKGLFDKKAKLAVTLELSMLNGYMRLSYEMGNNSIATKALEALGFRKDPQYYMTRIRNQRHLIKQAELWAEAEFNTSSKVDNDTFELLSDELAGGNLSSGRRYTRLMGTGNFRNYLRQEFKPSADKKLLNMFALVTDGGAKDPAAAKEAEKSEQIPNYGVAYLCLPYGSGHPASKLAVSSKFKASSTRWYISSPELSIFVNNVAGAKKVLKSILDAGIAIENLDELKKEASHVKKAVAKDDHHVDVKGPQESQDREDEEREEKTKPVKKTIPKKPFNEFLLNRTR